MLSSDRDICELLQQRLAQTPKPGDEIANFDLDRSKAALEKAPFEKGFVGRTTESSKYAEDDISRTRAVAASRSFNQAGMAVNIEASFTNPEPCRPLCTTDREIRQATVNSSNEPHDERSAELIDRTDAASTCSDTSKKRALTSPEVPTKRTKIDGYSYTGGRRMDVAFVPDVSKLAVSLAGPHCFTY